MNAQPQLLPEPDDLAEIIAAAVLAALNARTPPTQVTQNFNVRRLVPAEQISAGHTDRRRKRWATDEEDAARALRDAGWTFERIGRALGRTSDGVRRRLEELHGR